MSSDGQSGLSQAQCGILVSVEGFRSEYLVFIFRFVVEVASLLSRCLGQAAIHLCTGTIAPQMLGEVVDPVEVMAAMRAEHYTENRKD